MQAYHRNKLSRGNYNKIPQYLTLESMNGMEGYLPIIQNIF